MPDSLPPVVQVKNLTLVSRTTGKVLLHEIDLKIHQGEQVALLGGSGAGKSLLASTMLGLYSLKKTLLKNGLVIINGYDTSMLSKADLQKMRCRTVRMILQDPVASLNPTKTSGEHILEALKLARYKESSPLKKRVLELLTLVGFSDAMRVFRMYAHQLSGGECQRVCIAIALAGRPKILIADEPCSSLDPIASRHIMKLLSDLSKSLNMALLFISHNVEDAFRYSTLTYVLRDGLLVEALKSSELPNAKHSYTKRLLNKEIFSKEEAKDQQSASIMQAKNLSVVYKKMHKLRMQKHQALYNVSFDVKEGRVLGICGASGCGKTTLALRLANLLTGEGEISLFGKSLPAKMRQDDKAFFRQAVQVIPQSASASLSIYKSVYDNLIEGAKYYDLYHADELPKRVEEVLSWVRLSPNVLETGVLHLSGGERQRINIARTLLLKPKVLIMDEPTSALDLLAKERIIMIMDELRRTQNIGFVVITHDVDILRRIADDVLFLDQGRVREYGPAEQFYRSQDPVVLEFFGNDEKHSL